MRLTILYILQVIYRAGNMYRTMIFYKKKDEQGGWLCTVIMGAIIPFFFLLLRLLFYHRRNGVPSIGTLRKSTVGGFASTERILWRNFRFWYQGKRWVRQLQIVRNSTFSSVSPWCC